MNSILKLCPESQKTEIHEIKNEEMGHIEFWINFVSELGIPKDQIKKYSGLEKTKNAVDNLHQLMNTFEGGAAAMYALEKEIPKISESKIEGLKKFYGLSSDKALEYFILHTEADIRHAKSWENILNEVPSDRHENLYEISKKSLEAQNLLLDACFEAYCS